MLGVQPDRAAFFAVDAVPRVSVFDAQAQVRFDSVVQCGDQAAVGLDFGLGQA
ncbi:hypothetical protein D3C71_1923920 [compost metagenome]